MTISNINNQQVVCNCGSIDLPIGGKHFADGLFLKIIHSTGEIILKLVHNVNVSLQNGQEFVTSTERCTIDNNLIITGLEIFSNIPIIIDKTIQISISEYLTDKFLAYEAISIIESKKIYLKVKNLTTNLNNKKLLIHFKSICENSQCCSDIDLLLNPQSLEIDIPCQYKPIWYCVDMMEGYYCAEIADLRPGYYCVDAPDLVEGYYCVEDNDPHYCVRVRT